ncbi:MAG: hypothetical protein KUG81_09215 [Gammaproteobacteria bacterium]|nr:hypothetical protein [Gammaproteobacteria bacterium]
MGIPNINLMKGTNMSTEELKQLIERANNDKKIQSLRKKISVLILLSELEELPINTRKKMLKS